MTSLGELITAEVLTTIGSQRLARVLCGRMWAALFYIRILLALTFIYLYAYEYITGTLGLVLMLVTLFFNISSIVGYCPLYDVLGINTYKVKDR